MRHWTTLTQIVSTHLTKNYNDIAQLLPLSIPQESLRRIFIALQYDEAVCFAYAVPPRIPKQTGIWLGKSWQ